jgi:hypothetical protein
MDTLIKGALDAAALRPATPCERHSDREGTLAISLPSIGIMRYWCQECRDEYDRTFPSKGFGRAFGTGTGKEAHAEAQESKRLQEDYDRARPTKERR